MAILSIDPGLTTGWASGSAHAENPHERGLTGSHPFAENRSCDYGDLGDRFGKWLAALMRARQCTRLVIERQFGAEDANSSYLQGLAFVAHIVAYQLKVPRHEIPPASWKLLAVGKGNASKKEVQAAMEKSGWRASDEHGYDAAAILVAYRIKLNRIASK